VQAVSGRRIRTPTTSASARRSPTTRTCNRVPTERQTLYSSTSLLGGFDQPIGRQRVFGKAIVSGNRYQDEKQLITSATRSAAARSRDHREHFRRPVYVNFDQNLADPGAYSGVSQRPEERRPDRTSSARLRWGGPSLLTLEGAFEYSSSTIHAPLRHVGDKAETGSVTLYYRPGGPLRLGLGYRQAKPTAEGVPDASGNSSRTR
jgi:hypothetical protein